MRIGDPSPALTLGVIGGSGLYDIEGLERVEEISVRTPFGAPSDAVTSGWIDDIRLLFIPRHGRGHRLSPSEVPYRANIWALKQLGAQKLVSVSAVGSLREEIAPGHVVIPDQLVDRTKGVRPSTFFEDGIVAHVQLGDPYCEALRGVVSQAARAEGATVHDGGTLVCMEGPQFSTRAESMLYRSWGLDIVGMTALPEAKLAREAELCYATLALATDYDCWHEAEADVTVDAVMAILAANTSRAKRILRGIVGILSVGIRSDRPLAGDACGCSDALAGALITAPDSVTDAVRSRLSLLISRHGF